MSPAPPQSTSSTPPPAANHNVNHHVNNTNSSVGHASATAMASFGAPVPISTAHYGMPLSVSAFPPPPRRAEHSYAHYAPQQQQHQYPYMANGPATLPPPAPPSHALPKNRALQLPQSSSMLIQSPTIVPPVPSSAPDAPPSGSGPASGARKRPKYTRSKKGCLTCRSKKIKCDERKPMCTRCEHGHREVRLVAFPLLFFFYSIQLRRTRTNLPFFAFRFCFSFLPFPLLVYMARGGPPEKTKRCCERRRKRGRHGRRG